MTATDVLVALERLDATGVGVWIDGGWGIDALLGRQTREHRDLDLAVGRDDLQRAQVALAPLGFAFVPEEEPGLPARLVLRDPAGRQIDFHPLVFDSDGDGLQELGGGEWGTYPAAGLRGRGRIAGRDVRCITAELQLGFHAGYELTDRDRVDVELLVERFGLEPARPQRVPTVGPLL